MSDHTEAAELAEARSVLLRAGADKLPRPPWQHPGLPTSDQTLVRFAAWLARDAAGDPELLAAGLRLLTAARAELDQTESALLFAARAAGLTWGEVAAALGLGSAQAAQQRLGRLLSRSEGTGP